MQVQFTSQAVTPELREWIVAQVKAGCAQADIVKAMLASGWDEAVARTALQQTLEPAAAQGPAVAQTFGVQTFGAQTFGFQTYGGAVAAAAAVPAQAAAAAAVPAQAAAAAAVPAPDLSGASSVLRLPDREVQVLFTLARPRAVLFGGFLSDAECDQLKVLALPRLARSETMDNSTGGTEVNAARTSDGMFFERGEAPLIRRIEQRIAALLQWPVEKGEGLQVLRYRPGAEYRPHFDYFDPAQPGTAAVLKRGGQRLGTLLMYLNTPDAGGATIFPDVQLDVAPIKGHALFFSYDRPDPATGTLHGGAPVTAGEKWVSTKWLREGVFD